MTKITQPRTKPRAGRRPSAQTEEAGPFARAMRQQRTARDLTFDALSAAVIAAGAKASAASLSHYERGSQVPPLDVALCLSRILGISLDSLKTEK